MNTFANSTRRIGRQIASTTDTSSHPVTGLARRLADWWSDDAVTTPLLGGTRARPAHAAPSDRALVARTRQLTRCATSADRAEQREPQLDRGADAERERERADADRAPQREAREGGRGLEPRSHDPDRARAHVG